MIDDHRYADRIEHAGPDELSVALRRLGHDVNTMAEAPEPPPAAFDVFALADGWLRADTDANERLRAAPVADPVCPDRLSGAAFWIDEQADDLAGLVRCRVDLAPGGDRWVNVLRPPDREAYVGVVYRRGVDGPQREGLVVGVYPDVVLAGEAADRLVLVQPVPGATDRRVRAVLAPVDGTDVVEPTELARGTAAELSLRACSRRRFVLLESGRRDERRVALVDVQSAHPVALPLPAGTPPGLVDVARRAGADVLVKVTAEGQGWRLWVAPLPLADAVGIPRFTVVASGSGSPEEMVGADGAVLLRTRHEEPDDRRGAGAERVWRVPMEGAPVVVWSAPVALRLSGNSCVSTAGFSVLEFDPAGLRTHFFDAGGRRLGPIAERATAPRRLRHAVASADGFPVVIEARWRGEDDGFLGPVVLFLYGAYGMDVDLDADPQLNEWLDHGFAVATAHVRGGAGAKHGAGRGANRGRAVADAEAATAWLRSAGGRLCATRLVVVGPSAGGFLAASLLVRRPGDVDLGVIVNGFVDPLGSLLRDDSPTADADRDEWGDPRQNPRDRLALEALSTVQPLKERVPPDGPPVLVVVAGRDVRVDPRQGVAWFLRYRGNGGRATLWYDPDGTHDRWGLGMPAAAMADWAVDALSA